MEKVVDAFIKLVETFRQSPVSFLLVLLVTVGVYMVYSQTEYIVSLLPDPKQESAQFQMSLQRDLTINEALESNLEYLSADSIVISQFHNGQYDLTRLPFTKISTTYAVGIDRMEEGQLYGPRPLSTMNRLMIEMWKDKENPQCITRVTAEIEDDAFRRRVEDQHQAFISLCPLTNLLNYPIGYLAVGYEFVPDPKKVDILLSYQRTLTGRIAGYLQEGVAKNAT